MKSSVPEREKFIRMKYEQAAFVTKSTLSQELLDQVCVAAIQTIDLLSCQELYNSCKENDPLNILRLLFQGASVNMKCAAEGNMTPLHAAVIKGHTLW